MKFCFLFLGPPTPTPTLCLTAIGGIIYNVTSAGFLDPLHSVIDPGHIQANLEDELVQEALRKGLDLRQYSRQIESELRKVELRSIEDCILFHSHAHAPS